MPANKGDVWGREPNWSLLNHTTEAVITATAGKAGPDGESHVCIMTQESEGSVSSEGDLTLKDV